MIESPKRRFQKTSDGKAFADLSASPLLQSALDVALLQLDYELGRAQDMGTAAAHRWQQIGAARFKDILLTLTDVEQKSTRLRSDNLNPNV